MKNFGNWQEIFVFCLKHQQKDAMQNDKGSVLMINIPLFARLLSIIDT